MSSSEISRISHLFSHNTLAHIKRWESFLELCDVCRVIRTRSWWESRILTCRYRRHLFTACCRLSRASSGPCSLVRLSLHYFPSRLSVALFSFPWHDLNLLSQSEWTDLLEQPDTIRLVEAKLCYLMCHSLQAVNSPLRQQRSQANVLICAHFEQNQGTLEPYLAFHDSEFNK